MKVIGNSQIDLFKDGGKKENSSKYEFDSSVYPHSSDTTGLLAE